MLLSSVLFCYASVGYKCFCRKKKAQFTSHCWRINSYTGHKVLLETSQAILLASICHVENANGKKQFESFHWFQSPRAPLWCCRKGRTGLHLENVGICGPSTRNSLMQKQITSVRAVSITYRKVFCRIKLSDGLSTCCATSFWDLEQIAWLEGWLYKLTG